MNTRRIILTLFFTLLSSPVLAGPPLEFGLVNSVDENWVTVNLSQTYSSPVVVATPNYDGSFAPLVVRVRNAAGSSFEMRVVDTNNPGQNITGIDVYYFVVEQGVYTEAEHGIKMEAVRYTSTVTDSVGSWIGQQQTYGNSYANPVVLGQVMTENDIDFSVFWSRGVDRFEVPDSTVLYTGKHVGEDPDTTRANETIGYVVVEVGSYNINGQYITADIGTDSIQGIDDSPPYAYPISGINNVTGAVVSQTRMRGSNGSWALFYGADPISPTAINLAVDEDQLNDPERAHAGERVAYMIFGNQSNSPPTAVDDSFSVSADSVDNPLDVLSNDSDPDVGDTLTIVATGTPDNGGSVSINATSDGLIYSPATGFEGTETFTYTIEDPSGASDQATVSVTVTSWTGLPIENGVINHVDENWVTVNLSQTYSSPVVVATPNYDGSFAPLVVRVRNAAGSSFEMRVVDTNNPGQNITGIDVYYFVVEQGVYTEAEHGIKMEAVRYTSTVTDAAGSWVGQQQTYANSYANPVVLGQVMTENDIDFSVFWSRGVDRFEVPDPTVLYTGKHVGEDPDTTRANETIGYVVVEAGAYDINGQYITADIGADSIQGIDDSPPYAYPISGINNVTGAVVSQTRMRGSNGSWALFYGADPISDTALNLAVDEDQLNDTERAHAGERVAYIIFGNQSNSPPTAVDDSFSVDADSVDNPLDVLSNDSDPDVGDTLTIVATGTPDNEGSVSINATSDGLIYSPATGFEGTETFTYTIEDPSGASDQATVTVTVSSTNSPPTAVDDSFSVDADSVDNPLDVLSNDSDPDVGDTLTIVATGTPDNEGSVSINATSDGLIYSPATGFEGTETFTYTIEDPSGASDQATVSVTVASWTEPPIENGVINNVDENWVTVNLSQTYGSPVVIATPNYDGSFAPLVVRVRNAAGSSFEMRVVDTNNPSQDITGIDVYYFVVEQGVYTEAEHGIKMEAVRYTSTVTDAAGSWIGQQQTYANSYANPVVLGQVMTENDIDFSVFWSRGAERHHIPNPTVLYTGKHVGEDPDTTRANETIGYVVVEAGAYDINGQYMVANVGTASIQGVDDFPPYFYPIPGLSDVTGAVVSQTGMWGSNGSWALFYGADPISPTALNLAVDEDQLNDTERAHAGERLAYMIFGNQSNSPPTAVDDSFSVSADSVDNPLDVLFNDSDPDVGDTLTIVATGTPDNGGSVSINATSDGLIYSPATGFEGTETFTYTIEDPSGASDQATVTVTVASWTGLPIENGVINHVDENWVTVNLSQTYSSPVVVATPNYDGSFAPLVVRVRNAAGSSFEMRVVDTNNPGQNITGIDVYYFVVEQGVYTEAEHGIKMEAVRYTSTVTDAAGSWVGQQQTYANSYANPVVLGQVMTENDVDFSVFWSCGAERHHMPNPTLLYTGKHVGEDPDTTRANEMIGYVVVEAGAYDINGQYMVANLGTASIQGIDDFPPYAYPIPGLSGVTGAIVSQTGMWGSNGSWALFYGTDPISDTALNLAVDEDQLNDTERAHAGERVAFLAFGYSYNDGLPYSEDFSSGTSPGWVVYDEAGDPSNWVVENNEYHQKNQVRLGRINLDDTFHMGSFSYFDGGFHWTDYRFTVDVTALGDQGDDAGVMFYYRDADEYYRLSLDTRWGSTRLEKIVSGMRSTLAANAIGYSVGETFTIKIELKGNLIIASINDKPLFGIEDTSVYSGTVALYSSTPCVFDNVSVEELGTTTTVVIDSPLAHSLIVADPTLPGHTLQVSALVHNFPANGWVEFLLDGADPKIDDTAPFSAEFNDVSTGFHVIDAIVYDSSGVEITRDTNERIGVGGDSFITIGDSLTNGALDMFPWDNISKYDWILGKQGYQVPLSDQLTDSLDFPNIVYNEGIGADKAVDVFTERLDTILDRRFDANRVLFMIGTNDTNNIPYTKTGLGCLPGQACYTDSYKESVQLAIDLINSRTAAGDNMIETIYIAPPPPRFGDPSTGTYADPLNHPANTDYIQEYGQVIINELSGGSHVNIEVGPDFWDCFLGNENRFSLFYDHVHPNALGYVVMARLWHDVITGVLDYTMPCDSLGFILKNLSRSTEEPYLKQNVLTTGNEYYVDETFVITSFPDGLGIENGIWVMTANADRDNTDPVYVSFDVDRNVKVYVAYDFDPADPLQVLPSWLSSFTDTGIDLGVDDPVATLRLFEASFSAGTIQLGGNLYHDTLTAQGADSNYIVIVIVN